MKSFRMIACLLIVLTAMALGGCGSDASAVAQIEKFNGEVRTKLPDSQEFKAAVEAQQLLSGSAVESGDDSMAVLKFLRDTTQIQLGENTYFELRNFSENELQQLRGVAVYQVSPQKTEMRIQTPYGVATVLGTIFMLDICATSTALVVEEGMVRFENEATNVVVESGQKFVSGIDTKPSEMDPFELNRIFSSEKGTRRFFNLR